MRYEIITIMASLLCGLSFFPSPAQAKYGGGTGEPNDPYLIYTAEQMNAIGADYNDWDKYFKLMADVDLGQFDGKEGREKFNVIGVTWYNPFAGVFDGNDHTISNLTFDFNGVDHVGLFGCIVWGEVKNLGIESVSISGNAIIVGGLCGYNEGKITNSYSTGSVSGDESVGGLCGFNQGTIMNCYSIADVNGVSAVGGLVGINRSFPPFVHGRIYNSYSTGSVSGYERVGGLVGFESVGYIRSCYSTCDVTGSSDVGGLVGYKERDGISNCYSTGDVNGIEGVGGLVGTNWYSARISNCYSVGRVDGNDYVGGLVGRNGSYDEPECYSGLITSSYWDIENSGEPNMCGYQSDCSSGCDPNYGKTTYQLHQQSTFTDWDFINVWNIGENQTYPYLRVYLPSDINKDGIVNFLDIAITANQWMEGE